MFLHTYTASLHIGRSYQHHRAFDTLSAAKAWADETANCYAGKRIRVKVARPQAGGPLPVCEYTAFVEADGR